MFLIKMDQGFFFPVTFFGFPVTLFEKVPVILKKCPWQKTPNFAPENWLVARDKKAKKMPLKNEKWPWQFLQICKSARDNFWFLPVTKQKVPVTNQLFFLRNFKSPVKVTGFFFQGKVHWLFIHSKPRNFAFLPHKRRKKSTISNPPPPQVFWWLVASHRIRPPEKKGLWNVFWWLGGWWLGGWGIDG